MNDEVTIVHKDPFGGFISFDADREFTHFFEPFLHLIRDRMCLARVRHRADNEEISEGGNVPEIENAQIRGFLGFRCICGRPPVGNLCGLQRGLRLTGTAYQVGLNTLLRLAYYSQIYPFCTKLVEDV